MSEKTTETKAEKQAVKKQPSELQDVDLDEAQGGGGAGPARPASDVRGTTGHSAIELVSSCSIDNPVLVED